MAEIYSFSQGKSGPSGLPVWRAIRWTEAEQVLILAEMPPLEIGAVRMAPHEHAASLVEAGRLDDALTFTIHALPSLQAVSLACMCARDVARVEEPFQPALEAAEAWVANPSEARRRKCFELAEKVGFKSAASFASLASFWSGGSIAPENSHPVPVPKGLCGKAACASAKLAIGAGGPIEGPKRLTRYLEWAKAMAEGREVAPT